MRTIRAMTLAVVFVALLHSAVRAEPEAPDLPPSPPPGQKIPGQNGETHSRVAPPRKWFGYEIMLVDAASLAGGLLVGSANEGSDRQQAGDVIATTYGFGMIGAFSVHAAHDNAALGLAGTSARLLLPPIGAVLGVAGNCLAVAGEDPCSAAGGRGGFVFGMITASLLDSLAFARAETYDPSEAVEGERVWYGYQTLFIDGAALGASLALTLGRKHPDRYDDGVRMVGFPYLVGFLVSPWVHAFHGRIGTAFGSFGLRALVPALGVVPGIIAACAASGTEPRCTKEGAMWGIFGGSLLMAAIDIGAMSFERVPPAKSARTSILPYIMPSEDGHGFQAGLTGLM